MRKIKFEKIFKIVIDVLFVSQLFGILTLLIIVPTTAVVRINMQNSRIEEWTFLHWLLFLISVISYMLFMFGLFYLRRISKELIREKYFTSIVVKNLAKSGKAFLLSGGFMILISFIHFVVKITNGKLNLVYDTQFVFSLFVLTIGLFFLIQSKILFIANIMKQENDLTI